MAFDDDVRFKPEWDSKHIIKAFQEAPLRRLSVTRQIMYMSFDGSIPLIWTGLLEFQEIWTKETRASNKPFRFMTEMLPKCPQIEKLHVCLCENDAQGRSSNPSQRRSIIELPKLRDLAICVFRQQQVPLNDDAEIPYFDFWHSFSFPALQALGYTSAQSTSVSLPIQTPFPAAVGNILDTFTLDAVGRCDFLRGVKAARSTLEAMPKVETLILLPNAWAPCMVREYLEKDEADILMHLLRYPDDESRVILPKLRHLVLDYGGISGNDVILALLHYSLRVLLEDLYERQNIIGDKHDHGPITCIGSDRVPLETITLMSWPNESDEDRYITRKLEDLCVKYKVQLILQ